MRHGHWDWGDFILTDTPGTVAPGGEDDTLAALAAASSADLVLCLADDDAVREEEVHVLARLRAIGVPVVLAMNVKFDLARPWSMRRCLNDPGRLPPGPAGSSLSQRSTNTTLNPIGC